MHASRWSPTRRVVAIGVLAAVAPALGASSALGSAYTASSKVTPFLQWGPNYGYCGEASFIAAGMRFGQYTSQWTARRVASSRSNQTLRASQLLLGTSRPDGNAQTAAAAMRLSLESYDSAQQTSTADYLAWVKEQVVQGDAVIMGVLNNVNMLGFDPPGDAEYDHIVPVLGVGSEHPLEGEDGRRYFPTDTLTISDNGLYELGGRPFTSRFDAVQKTRRQANRGRAISDLYSVLSATGQAAANYAVAVTGPTDNSPGGPYVIPVSVASSRNNEGFPSADPMPKPPSAKRTTLTATVSIPDSGTAYRLYEYTSFAAVPRGNFNGAAAASPTSVSRAWEIPAGSGDRFLVRLPNVSTAGTYVFRAVPVSAP